MACRVLPSVALGESTVTIDEVGTVLPEAVRQRLEGRYWAPIGEAAAVERWIDDDELHRDPARHPALFSDHGVVHVRDIAANAVALAGQLHGTLLPERDHARQRLVAGVAVLLTYVHDIGMVEPTAAGRRVHPQFAAQTVLSGGFDDLALDLWDADAAGLRTRLEAIERDLGPTAFAVPAPTVAREMVAAALGHSKSLVPAPVLDDRAAFRGVLVRGACTALDRLQETGRDPGTARDPAAPSPVVARYRDVDTEAFAWLVDPRPPLVALADDVVDAVRVVRAADALRQRGTTLRTSAGYELCVDHVTGELVVGLRSADDAAAYLLRLHNPIGAAEANLRASWLTPDGRLTVGFYRGSFADPDVRRRLLEVTADVVADIEADAVGSFPATGAGRAPEGTVELSAPDDDPGFVTDLATVLATRHPRLAGRVRCVAGAVDVPAAPDTTWASGGRAMAAHEVAELFDRMARHGLRAEAVDSAPALAGARHVTVAAGTVLLQPGTAASVVVVPLGPGLAVVPSGGYAPRPLHPWLPVGVTGVVRGGERNAAVVAEHDADVLVVPADVYLTEWFRPYDLAALRRRLGVREGERAP